MAGPEAVGCVGLAVDVCGANQGGRRIDDLIAGTATACQRRGPSQIYATGRQTHAGNCAATGDGSHLECGMPLLPQEEGIPRKTVLTVVGRG